MSTYFAYELLAKLNCLQLVGQHTDGELEWVGKDSGWKRLVNEEENILREWDRKTTKAKLLAELNS